ncbi:dead-domain-containing protein, partial [Chrysochromulina tobinii]
MEAYDDIPVEASGEDCPPPIEQFGEIALHPSLMANIQQARFTKPTPTGSGKTGAFLFPTLHQMLHALDAQPDPGVSQGRAEPRALILAPTRELANQIMTETRKFAQRTPIHAYVVYGGADIRQQMNQLDRGCHLLVATPGRLCDLVERGKVSLHRVHHLILDEADRMLDMGFEPQIRRVVEREGMPPAGQRQTLMFSATFPKEIQRLASEFMTRYIFVAVGRVGSTTALITQTVVWAEEQDKRRVLLEQLAACTGRTIIFVETKRAAEQLEEFLHRSSVPATSIHGDRSQREREQALLAFRRGSPSVLVATDVAARGLDVPECMHVINYELPREITSYVHRIGRTGRMGRHGTATSLFSYANKPVARELVTLLQEANQECPDWLLQLAAEGGAPFRGYGGSRGSKFGGRDFRQNAQ